MADFVEISILDTAARCGIKVIDPGKTEVAVNCPFCGDQKKHLRLNTVKQVYYCPRCGESGNAVTLYAKLIGVDNKTAYLELIAGDITNPTVMHKLISDTVDREALPLAARHAVYTELLQNLDLSARHKNNLLKRGLNSVAIERNLYRTVPDSVAANRIVEGLSQRFSLTGIPGFYTKDNTWRMALHKGFFISVRTREGLIQGLQIRLDDAKKRKYRWFSSNHKENGAPAHSWIHVANRGGSDVYIISEGALKADVSAFLTGDCFIGIPGVNCTRGLVQLLNSMGVRSVYEALDMDKYTNKSVNAAANHLHRTLSEAGITCIPCVWDSKHNKGIDDYLLSCI